MKGTNEGVEETRIHLPKAVSSNVLSSLLLSIEVRESQFVLGLVSMI